MKGSIGVSMQGIEYRETDKKDKYKKKCKDCKYFEFNSAGYKRPKDKRILPYCCSIKEKGLYYTSKVICRTFLKK